MATTVARDPQNKLVPYLAESWQVSEDGLTWEFKLRKGVKFHDGTPLTAQDYAFTFNRMWDPNAKFVQGTTGKGKSRAEAVDDYTLRLIAKEFSAYTLDGLAHNATIPLSQAYVEKVGDQIARQPLGVGPYKFKEWRTGDRVVLERNPDYTWAPSLLRQGPYYIQTIEFRIIPEVATILGGMEAGEIDYAGVEAKDLQRIKDTGQSEIYETLQLGMWPALHMNVSQPPFDDLRVRRAFNLAVDKETLIKVVLDGHGVPQYGPISPNMTGYWPGVEQIGYRFDLAKAKALMQEAGYTVGAGGILQKDGKPLRLTLKSDAYYTKLAEVIKEQYKALGVEVEIQIQELGLLFADSMAGKYELAVLGYGNTPNAGILYTWYHPSRSAAINPCRIDDPELAELLDGTRAVTDLAKNQELVDAAQKRIVEQAYVVPLYQQKNFAALAKRVKGAVFSSLSGSLYLNDAYIETN